ncbi:hypothetical protein [Janthinobacterium sp. PSPC2-1]|uniref:hypothetical protein n=1 Tax=unclassified Janthinobacterium TaxID=2610881 RepID=UPI003CF04FC8
MHAIHKIIALRAIAPGEEEALARLFQLYCYDNAAWSGEALLADGRCGVALEVVRRVLLDSEQTWLVAMFRTDAAACAFWRQAFARLPFARVEAYDDAALPQFQLYLLKPAA